MSCFTRDFPDRTLISSVKLRGRWSTSSLHSDSLRTCFKCLLLWKGVRVLPILHRRIAMCYACPLKRTLVSWHLPETTQIRWIIAEILFQDTHSSRNSDNRRLGLNVLKMPNNRRALLVEVSWKAASDAFLLTSKPKNYPKSGQKSAISELCGLAHKALKFCLTAREVPFPDCASENAT